MGGQGSAPHLALRRDGAVFFFPFLDLSPSLTTGCLAMQYLTGGYESQPSVRMYQRQLYKIDLREAALDFGHQVCVWYR